MIDFMFRRLVDDLLNTVFPLTCLACKERLTKSSVDGLICGKCWEKIRKNKPPFCHSCGRGLMGKDLHKSLCPSCRKTRFHFDRAFSPCVYDGVIKELIHAFKYRDKKYLGAPLSRLMTEFIKEFEIPVDFTDLIVPVPLHAGRLREREFNQAAVLAENIAQEFGKTASHGLLERTRATSTQTQLDTLTRLENVRGSFRVPPSADLRGKRVLLVDDVMTTGATSSEAALALKQAGAHVVFVLSLAN
jgi:competence protein ComFC